MGANMSGMNEIKRRNRPRVKIPLTPSDDTYGSSGSIDEPENKVFNK